MRFSSRLRVGTIRQQTVDRRSTRPRLELELLEDRTLPSGTTFTPIVAASITDQPLDGNGDAFNTVFDGLLRQSTPLFLENRAVVEFDLATVTAPVDLAVLDFRLAVNGQGTPQRNFDVYVYAGNGQRDLADFSSGGTKIGTVTLLGSEGGDDYRLDVTGAVRALLQGSNSFVGVRVDPVNDVTPSLFLDAQLTINGAPAPTGLRGWEIVPNAIRMNATDTFHLEVDVGGAVKSVKLDPFSVYLVPPSAGTLILRDDGLGGDRVAGDFIFTSGEFHYDTSKTYENDFYQGDPSSPAGVHIEDVGDVTVEELDGSTSTFLLRPAVGLIRADLPLVTPVQVTPDIVVTEHLINISTDAHATQRTLRGPANVMYQVTKPLYEQFRDTIDEFMFFSTNKLEQLPSRTSSGNFNAGVHLDAQVGYSGTGRDPFDNTAWYGSSGRLQGLNLLDAYQRGIWGANATHELTHQWSAYLDPALGVTEFGGHYDNHSSAGSLVGGFQWTPNGDGSYTIQFNEGRNGATHAPDIDLYLMGLLDASEVDPIRAYSGPYKQPANPIVQASEITKTVTIDDIIARYGPRMPAVGDAQRGFNLAFVAESNNRLLTPVELTFYEIFAAHYTKPIPANQPDPYVGDGWQSITRFFGHGSTWSSAVPAVRGLTADIVDVAPDPRATAVSQISIVFSDPASGFDLSDLRMTRDGGGNLLTGAETLSSTDGITWTLSGLSGLTGTVGNYQLALVASGSGIQGPDGKPLLVGAIENWSKVLPKATLSIGSTTVAEAGGTTTITATLSQVTDQDVIAGLTFAGSANLGVDYTRSAAQLTIPGGQTQASLTVTAFQDALDEDDEAVVVDIASVTGAVEEGTQQVALAITDDDAAPTISFSSGSYPVGEADGSKTIAVNLSTASGKTVTVDYTTGNGTASSSDYNAASGTLNIAPGATSGAFSVPIINDSLDENDETVNLTLSNPSNASLGTFSATLTITDDDSLPSLTIGDATPLLEGNTGVKSAQFVVQLSAASGRTVSVNYVTTAGTATSGADYTAASGTVSFAPGETTKAITVSVIGDRLGESNETLFVNLGAVTNAIIADGQGLGTILDDEPRVTINDVSKQEGKKNQTTLFTFTITLSAAYDQAVTMSFRTLNGTGMTADKDYVAMTGTLTFAAGQTTKTVTIEVKGDTKRESNETFYVELYNLSSDAIFTKNRGLGTIVNDD